MNDIAFKVIIKNDGIDDVIFKTLMLKGEKGDKGDAGGAEIDDSTTSASKTWSSNKIRNEIDAKPVNLSQLGDVDLDTITDGQMLGYNLTAGKWKNKTADASTLKYDANTSIKDKIDAKADSAGLSLVAVSGAYDDLSNKPQLADVATSGDYDDLSNKPTIPDELVEMSDVDIDALSLADGDCFKWNATTGKWENGAVLATSALVDLTDVALDSPIPDFSSLVYNATAGKWKNKQLIIACTQAQYNAWKNASPSQLIPCTYYILTDAQNLNATADDIEYSSGVSVADELTSLDANKQDTLIPIDLSSQITIQTGFALKSWGSITVTQYGKLVFVVISGLYASNNISSATNCIKLPKIANGMFNCSGNDDDRNTVLFSVNDNTDMIKIDVATANKNLFATLIYVTY